MSLPCLSKRGKDRMHLDQKKDSINIFIVKKIIVYPLRIYKNWNYKDQNLQNIQR